MVRVLSRRWHSWRVRTTERIRPLLPTSGRHIPNLDKLASITELQTLCYILNTSTYFSLEVKFPPESVEEHFLQEYSDVSNLPHNIDRLLFAKDFEYAYCSFRPEHLFVDFFYLKLTTFIYSAILVVLVPLNGFQLDGGRQNYVTFFKEHTFWFKLCPFRFNNTLVYFINTFRQEKFTNANNAWRSSCRMIPTSRQATYCTAS